MLSYELRKVIYEFIQSNITVQQLEEWLVPRLPTLIKKHDSSDADVVATIELGLAEMSDGVRTEEDFRRLLIGVVCEQATVPPSYSSESFSDITASSNSTQTPTLVFPVADVLAMAAMDQQQYESI